MKSVWLIGKNVTLCDIAEPQILNPTDVKMKIAYSSICGYEMMIYRSETSHLGNQLMGHEASGIVVETGSAVQDLHIGDAVTLCPSIHCGVCSNCRKGRYDYCLNADKNYAGFMREFVVLDQKQVYKLPPSLSLREGCLIEPLMVAVRALENARLGYNRKLLIVGGGAMGMLLLKAAQLYPIEGVVILDPNESKRETARSCGAALALDPKGDNLYYELMDYTGGAGFDAVIEASGDSAFVSRAFNLLARGGDFVLLSMYEVDFQIPISALHLYWKDATLHPVYPHYSRFSEALSVAHRLDIGSVITAVYPYTQAEEAFARKDTDHDQLKVVLQW